MASKLLRPLFDRVLVQRAKAGTQSIGGILLPESAVQKNNEGTVVAVGPGKRLADGSFTKPAVKEGDTVILADSYSSHKIKLNNQEYELVQENDLLGILEKK